MSLLAIIIVFNLIGSVISLAGGALLLLNKQFAIKISHYLSSFAAGTLLGAVFFDLLPEAIEHGEEHGTDAHYIFIFVLLGVLAFFILERVLHWFHHHGFDDHEVVGKPVVPLLIIGDAIHNFIDGVAIAASFLISVPLGIITTFAVGAHEIPQEIGDFGVMLKNGLSRKKVIIVNILSSLASFIGVLFAFYFGSLIEGLSVIILALASGLFLYVSLSDLIPEIHHENKKGLAVWETLSLFLGVAVIYIALFFINSVLGVGH